jgi:hypothetical protein
VREVYRDHVIEARPEGKGHVRIWHAFIGGRSMTYVCYSSEPVTRSFKTASSAMRVARDYLDPD